MACKRSTNALCNCVHHIVLCLALYTMLYHTYPTRILCAWLSRLGLNHTTARVCNRVGVRGLCQTNDDGSVLVPVTPTLRTSYQLGRSGPAERSNIPSASLGAGWSALRDCHIVSSLGELWDRNPASGDCLAFRTCPSRFPDIPKPALRGPKPLSNCFSRVLGTSRSSTEKKRMGRPKRL